MSFYNRHASAPDLKVQFENACDVNLSARTVQRRLLECGLLAYRPKKKAITHKIKKKAEVTFMGKAMCFMDNGSMELSIFFG